MHGGVYAYRPDLEGVVHQASAYLVNAVWDAWAKHEGLPVWRLVARMSPSQLAAAIDLSGITDAVGSSSDVAARLEAAASGRATRVAELETEGVGCYTTATGWAGYPDEKVRGLVRAAIDAGFTQFKMKVGLGRKNDLRRAELIRSLLDEAQAQAPQNKYELMMDANSVWEVQQAIDEMRALAHLKPAWIEEPISPDDAVGQGVIAAALNEHVPSCAVASGEQCSNKVMMKQFLHHGLGVCQADAVKAGGLNEWLACALLAERKGVPMCPHAGGVGLCNMAAHLSCIDYACINPAMPLAARTTEYIDFLQEHFVHPVTLLRGGRYAVPTCAGWGLDMKPASLDMYEWPGGVYWSSRPEHFDAAGTPW